MSRDTRESLTIGIACLFLGCLASRLVANGHNDPDSFRLIAIAAITAFVSGFAFWRLLVARKERPTRLHGSLAVVAAAVLGHFITMQMYIFTGPAPRVSDGAHGMPDDILFGLLIGALSLVYIGWLTIPLGALLGYCGIVLRNRASSPSQSS